MNIQKFNTTTYSSVIDLLQDMQQLATLLGLNSRYDEENCCTYIYHGEDDSYGIKIQGNKSGTSQAPTTYLYNSIFTSTDIEINSTPSKSYIYYAISNDGKSKCFGFSEDSSMPALSIFITEGKNVDNENDIKVFFGGQSKSETSTFKTPTLVTKDFYEKMSYQQDIVKDEFLITLVPFATLNQNKTYKLTNLYIPLTFLNTGNTKEFLLKDKYYVSALAYSAAGFPPRWVMQI